MSRWLFLVPNRARSPVVVLLSALLAQAEVVRDELRSSVTFDIGQVMEGSDTQYDLAHQMIQRTGISMTQGFSVNNRLDVTVGIGGLFWYSTPETDLAYQRYVKFGPGVGQARAKFKLGSVDEPWGSLQVGLIPYKYNPDAKNLGEYLFRSNAYPNTIMTGGWSFINSAGILMEGAALEAHTGPLTHDLLISMERNFEPLHDLSAGYLLKFTPSEAFEVQAGVAFAHLIPAQPRKTTPKGPADPAGDKTRQPLNRYDADADTVVTDPLDSTYENYTFKSIKLMGRFSFNPQAILQSEFLHPEDMKIYMEAALLGVKNYPFYYEKWWTRLPIMVGFNVPTFKLLDQLSVEFEYRKPEFANNIYYSYVRYSVPIPHMGENAGSNYAEVLKNYDRDALMKAPLKRNQGVKWSVYGRREIVPGFKLHAQVASDHYRGLDASAYPRQEVITKTPSDWYYVIRFELGI